jgi:glycine C-acetyltransferase
MDATFLAQLEAQTDELHDTGLFKQERTIASPQQAVITLEDGSDVINMCANNYLGLANHPSLVEAAASAVREYGYGMSSVRFICGTQTIHKTLEAALSDFLSTEDTILYSSCFDANGGLFETLLGPDDAVISDSLNHASIIETPNTL